LTAVFVALPVAGQTDRIEAFLESTLTKVDPPGPSNQADSATNAPT
jgi:hypothetical protein